MNRKPVLFLLFFCLGVETAGAQQRQDWMKSWVYGGRSRSEVKDQLVFDSQQRLTMIDRLCTLDDVQQQKLSKAAGADISRFFREVDTIERKLETMDVGAINQNLNEVWQVVSPIQQKMRQGVFAEKSLFQKVVRKTLSDQQQSVYQAELERVRRRRWKIVTRLNVADIERSMPLMADQRKKLLALLDEQKLSMKMQKQIDGYAGFLKLMKIQNREATLSEFLDADQSKVIASYCERFKGWEGMIE